MSRKKKEKKPMSKKAKIILLSVILGIVALLAAAFFIVVLPFLTTFTRMDFIVADTGENLVSTDFTMEQKLKDFDYMYDIVCLENPEKERIEQAYGISYDDVYNRYRDLVINSESDYEYFSYLGCFLSVLPGMHNYMGLPDYTNNAVFAEFSLSELYGKQEFKDYAYSWKEDFRDDVENRLGYNTIAFAYYDGSYIGFVPNVPGINCISDYTDAILISVDGKNPKDICFDVFERYVPTYDGVNDCFFRDFLIYNDGIGEKHTAEVLMPDGTVETIDIYDDPGFDYILLDGRKTYPELFDIPENTGTSNTGNTVTDVMSPDYVPSSYYIATDPERKLVYIYSTECDSREGPRLVADLTKALEEADADSIILDIRMNGGGDSSFVPAQLLPVLFSHDLTSESTVYGGRNSHTRKYYGNMVYKILDASVNNSSAFKTKGKYYYYTETFTVEGRAAKDYKIYVLTGFDTFSSGDIMTRICKEYDNCVLIGTNTAGEGVSGVIIQCYLPETHFMFAYAPTVNIDCPEDSFLGTEPDIYVPFTLDEYYTRSDLYYNQGLSIGTYDVRLMWDQTLVKAVEMAEND